MCNLHLQLCNVYEILQFWPLFRISLYSTHKTVCDLDFIIFSDKINWNEIIWALINKSTVCLEKAAFLAIEFYSKSQLISEQFIRQVLSKIQNGSISPKVVELWQYLCFEIFGKNFFLPEIDADARLPYYSHAAFTVGTLMAPYSILGRIYQLPL